MLGLVDDDLYYWEYYDFMDIGKYVTRGGVNQYKLVRLFNACSSSWVFISLLS